MTADPVQLLADPWSLAGMVPHREEQHVMTDDDRLADLIDAFSAQNDETLRAFSDVDLDATLVVPDTFAAFARMRMRMRMRIGRCAGR